MFITTTRPASTAAVRAARGSMSLEALRVKEEPACALTDHANRVNWDCFVRLERCVVPRGAALRLERAAPRRERATTSRPSARHETLSPHLSRPHERKIARKKLSGSLKRSDKIENSYICEICKKQYYSLACLTTHKLSHALVHAKMTIPLYVCDICHRGFATHDALRTHKRAHHERARPFECHICKKMFTRPNYLYRHLAACREKLSTFCKGREMKQALKQSGSGGLLRSERGQTSENTDFWEPSRPRAGRSCAVLLDHTYAKTEYAPAHECLYPSDSSAESVRAVAVEAEPSGDGLYTIIDYDKDPICDLCGRRFALKSDLMRHVVVHIHTPAGTEQDERSDGDQGRDLPRFSWRWARLVPRECRVRLERCDAPRGAATRRERAAMRPLSAGDDAPPQTRYFNQLEEEIDVVSLGRAASPSEPTPHSRRPGPGPPPAPAASPPHHSRRPGPGPPPAPAASPPPHSRRPGPGPPPAPAASPPHHSRRPGPGPPPAPAASPPEPPPHSRRRAHESHKECLERINIKKFYDELKKQISARNANIYLPRNVILRRAASCCRKLRNKEIKLRNEQDKLLNKSKKLRTMFASLFIPVGTYTDYKAVISYH